MNPREASAQEPPVSLRSGVVQIGTRGARTEQIPTFIDATPLLKDAHLRLARMTELIGRAGGIEASAGGEAYVVGDRRNFWAVDFQRSLSFPYHQYEVEAECRAVGESAYYFVDIEQLSIVSAEALQEFVTAFEDSTPGSPRDPNKGIYQHVTEVFGDVPDVDGDPKIIILLTEIPAVAAGAAGTAYYAGYFYSVNQFADPVDFGGDIEQRSNHTEMLYVNSLYVAYEDPEDEVLTRLIRNRVKSTIAHEFQHLIQWENDPDEVDAVNEGLSEYASYITGFGLRWIAPYVSKPNVDMFTWRRYGDSEDDYSRVACWTYYLATRFGDSFIRELATNPQGGVTGVEASLSSTGGGTFADVFSDFITALYLNGEIEGDARFDLGQITSWLEPAIHENLHPSSERVYIEPHGAAVLRYWNCTDLSLSFPDGLPSGVNARVVRRGGNIPDVTPLTSSGSAVAGLGTTWREAAVVLTNGEATPSGTFRLGVTATQSDSGLVKYENGRPYLRINTEMNYWHFGTRITPEVAPAKITGVWAFYRGSSVTDLQVRTMHPSGSEWIVDETPIFSSAITPPFWEEGWIYVPVPDVGFYSSETTHYLVSMRTERNSMGYADLNQKLDRSFLRRSAVGPWEPLSNFAIVSSQLDTLVLSGDWMFRAEFAYQDETPPTVQLGLFQHPLFPSRVEVYAVGDEPLHHGRSTGTLTPVGSSAINLAFEATLGAFSIVDPTKVLSPGQVDLNVEAYDRYGGLSDSAELTVTVSPVNAGASASLLSAGRWGSVVIHVPRGEHDGTTLMLAPYEEVPLGLPGAPENASSILEAPIVSLGPADWKGPEAGTELRLPLRGLAAAGEQYRYERWEGGTWTAVPGGVEIGEGYATGPIPGGGWYRLAHGRAPAFESGIQDIKLFGNAPNPFNPRTDISFRIPQSMAGQKVQLKVLNVRGQVVKVLVDRIMGSGMHTVSWYGDNRSGMQVSSGIYLYRLEVAGKVLTRKMLLLR